MENTENNQSDVNQVIIKKSTFNKILVGVIVAIAVSSFFVGYFIGSETVEPQKIIISDPKEILNDQSLQFKQKNLPIMISEDDDPFLGNPNAEITMIEFSDFQCPFCKRFHRDTLPMIKSNYIDTGKIKFVYRDFPIQSTHPNALPAALAAECADDQKSFWSYHDKLFQEQDRWKDLPLTQALIVFKQYSSELKLNQEEFESCLDSEKYFGEVNKDYLDGVKYGVQGTPGFFLGNEIMGYTKIEGAKPFQIFQATIEGLLEK